MLTSCVDVVYQHDLDLKLEIRYHFFHFEVEIYLIVNFYIMSKGYITMIVSRDILDLSLIFECTMQIVQHFCDI